MPLPPQVTLDDPANTDARIATLLGSDPFVLLLIRASEEANELINRFDVTDTDNVLANKVRVWLARKEQLARLSTLIKNAAAAARETN